MASHGHDSLAFTGDITALAVCNTDNFGALIVSGIGSQLHIYVLETGKLLLCQSVLPDGTRIHGIAVAKHSDQSEHIFAVHGDRHVAVFAFDTDRPCRLSVVASLPRFLQWTMKVHLSLETEQKALDQPAAPAIAAQYATLAVGLSDNSLEVFHVLLPGPCAEPPTAPHTAVSCGTPCLQGSSVQAARRVLRVESAERCLLYSMALHKRQQADGSFMFAVAAGTIFLDVVVWSTPLMPAPHAATASAAATPQASTWSGPGSSAPETATLFRLKGHTGSIHRVRWSPDASLLASASDDRTLRVWDIPPIPLPRLLPAPAEGGLQGGRGGGTRKLPEGAPSPAPAGDSSGGGEGAVCGHSDSEGGSVRRGGGEGRRGPLRRGAETRASGALPLHPRHVLFGHTARLWDCDWGGGLLVTAAEDCTCRFWELGTGSVVAKIQGHRGRGIWQCVLHDDYLLTGGADASIKCWRLSDWLPPWALAALHTPAPHPQLEPPLDTPDHSVPPPHPLTSPPGPAQAAHHSQSPAAQPPPTPPSAAPAPEPAASPGVPALPPRDVPLAQSFQLALGLPEPEGCAVGAVRTAWHSVAGQKDVRRSQEELFGSSDGGVEVTTAGAPPQGVEEQAEQDGAGEGAPSCVPIEPAPAACAAERGGVGGKGGRKGAPSDSKAEWVRFLALAGRDVLYVATNRGLIHRVILPGGGSAEEQWQTVFVSRRSIPLASLCATEMGSQQAQQKQGDLHMDGMEGEGIVQGRGWHWVAAADHAGHAVVLKLPAARALNPAELLTWEWQPFGGRAVLGVFLAPKLGFDCAFVTGLEGSLTLWNLPPSGHCPPAAPRPLLSSVTATPLGHQALELGATHPAAGGCPVSSSDDEARVEQHQQSNASHLGGGPSVSTPSIPACSIQRLSFNPGHACTLGRLRASSVPSLLGHGRSPQGKRLIALDAVPCPGLVVCGDQDGSVVAWELDVEHVMHTRLALQSSCKEACGPGPESQGKPAEKAGERGSKQVPGEQTSASEEGYHAGNRLSRNVQGAGSAPAQEYSLNCSTDGMGNVWGPSPMRLLATAAEMHDVMPVRMVRIEQQWATASSAGSPGQRAGSGSAVVCRRTADNDPQDWESVRIISAGGDARVKTLMLHYSDSLQEGVDLVCCREEHFDSVTTIDGDVRSACQLKPLRTVYGFQASDFVIFDSTSDAQIARVPCGGWRRPSAAIAASPDSLIFCYVKDGCIHVYRRDARNFQGSALFPPNALHPPHHAKELLSIKLLAPQPCSHPRKKINDSLACCCVTGGEDAAIRQLLAALPNCHQNTAIQYDSMPGTGESDWFYSDKCFPGKQGKSPGHPRISGGAFLQADLLGNHAMGTAVKAISLVPTGPGSWLMMSGGAKEVLMVWQLSRNSSIPRSAASGLLCNWISTRPPPRLGFKPKSALKGKPSKDSDLRIMALSAFLPMSFPSADCKFQPASHPSHEVSAQSNTSLEQLAQSQVPSTSPAVLCAVVASSDATLSLVACHTTRRGPQQAKHAWQVISTLECHTCPVLCTAHVVLPHVRAGPGENSTSTSKLVSHILLSGATDGSVAVWDLTGAVHGYISPSPSSASPYQPNITMNGKAGLDTSSSAPGTLPPGGGQRLAGRVEPALRLKGVHQSGVNDMATKSLGSNRILVVTGGDDQALNFMLLACCMEECTSSCGSSCEPSSGDNPASGSRSNFRDRTESSRDGSAGGHLAAPLSQGYSPGIHLKKPKKKIFEAVTQLTVSNAHSSTVRGVWTDGRLAFSVGLDQRVRVWRLAIELGKMKRDSPDSCTPIESTEDKEQLKPNKPRALLDTALSTDVLAGVEDMDIVKEGAGHGASSSSYCYIQDDAWELGGQGGHDSSRVGAGGDSWHMDAHEVACLFTQVLEPAALDVTPSSEVPGVRTYLIGVAGRGTELIRWTAA